VSEGKDLVRMMGGPFEEEEVGVMRKTEEVNGKMRKLIVLSKRRPDQHDCVLY